MGQVSEILKKKGGPAETIRPNQSVMEAVRKMCDRRIGAVVVLEKETVVGIFTERDLLNRVVLLKKDPEKTDVGEVMTSPIAYVTPETDLADCRKVMTKKRIRHLPVVEKERLVGVVSIGDLVASEIADQETTIQYLKEYLYGRA